MKQTGYELLKIMGDLDPLLIEEAAKPLTPHEITPSVSRKTRLTRKILLIAAAVGLIGCLAVGMMGIWKWTQQPSSPIDAPCRGPLYSGNNMEDFVDYWQNSHFLVIPTSKTDTYTLEQIQEDENAYRFTFTPTDKGESDYSRSIRVYVSKPGGATMEGVTAQSNLTVQNGKAYHKRTNSWFIDCQGTLLSVDLPPMANADDFSTVTNLFSFVIYTTDGETHTFMD